MKRVDLSADEHGASSSSFSSSSSSAATLARVALSVDGIHVSPLDDRAYKLLELSNGLQALVVSDPATESASAAMDVHVGFHSDPAELPGLAHFCEHMLFLGTAKYPDENSYSAFLSAHGGSSNAFTSARDTNFYFDVGAAHLREALDRFAQFFVAPLFTVGATDREMNAVDSESTNYLQDDYWRINQVYRGLGNHKHPFHKYGVGNLQTLKTTPEEKQIDVREALLRYYHEYFSASIMKLVVYGKESVEELSRWVRSLFSAIPNSGRASPSFEGELPYTPDQLARRLEVVPVMDLKILGVTWVLPSLRGTKYTQQHASVLGHLIGHEGEGSLLSCLKRKKWANSVSAGIDEEHEEFSLFLVNFEVTEDGIEHADDILRALFQYLQLLIESPWSEWMFEELESLAIMHFLFQSKQPPINFTSTIAGNMQSHPKRDIISQGTLFYPFNAQPVLDLLGMMTPEKMKVLVVCKSVESDDMSQEQWYGTKYRDTALSSALLEQLKSPGTCEELALPAPNAFVTSEFPLVAANEGDAGSYKDPAMIRDDEICRVWHKTDLRFRKPRTHVAVTFHSPEVNASPHAYALSDLLVACVQDELSEFVYDASLAGMHYDLAVQGKTIHLGAVGYSTKLPVLVLHVVKAMSTFADRLREKTFDRVKHALCRAYENVRLEEAYRHAMQEGGCILQDKAWTQDELVAAIGSCTFDMLLVHCRRVFHQLFLEIFLYGNLDRTEASTFAQGILDNARTRFTLPVAPSQKFLIPRQVDLPAGVDSIYRLEDPNPDNANCAIDSIYQIGRENMLDRVRLALFAQIVQEPLFNQLRTKEQLGYTVFSTPSRASGVQFFRVIVQSNVAPPEYIEQRIDAFWTELSARLRKIEKQQFAKYVDAVVKEYSEKPKSQEEEVSALMFEISLHEYVFDRKETLGRLVQTLHLEDVVDFFDTFIRPGAPRRKKLSVQVHGNTAPLVRLADCLNDGWSAFKRDERAMLAGALSLDPTPVVADGTKKVFITNPHEFKQSMPLYDLPAMVLRREL